MLPILRTQDLLDLSTCGKMEEFRKESCERGYHIYKDIWNAALGLKYFACLIFSGKSMNDEKFPTRLRYQCLVVMMRIERGYHICDIWNASVGLKYFACLIFGHFKGHWQNLINNENFLNYVINV